MTLQDHWQRWLRHGVVFAVLFFTINIIGGYYAQVISPEQVGFIHDDGVYAILGKALAEGEGFRLIHMPAELAQTKYPVGYPVLLALGWMLNPVFPYNLTLLTLLTMTFSLLSFFLMFYYLRNVKHVPGWLAWIIILMCATNFYVIYFSTTIMSEAPYLFFTLLTIFYAETKLKNPTPVRIVIAAILTAVSFHMRILAFTLLAAIALWLWINRHKKMAGLYTAVSSLLSWVPWFIWVQLNKPGKLTAITYPIYKAYGNYGFEILENYSEKNILDGLLATLGSFIHKLLEVMFQGIPNFLKIMPQLEKQLSTEQQFLYIVAVVVCAYLLLGYFIYQLTSFVKTSRQNNSLSGVSIPALYVIFYIGVCIIWKYDEQMTRFLLVLLPWLWYYFFKPFIAPLQSAGFQAYAKAWPRLLGLGIAIYLCLWPSWHAYGGVRVSRVQNWIDMGDNRHLWNEYKATFNFINANLPADAVLGVEQDVVFYLYTNRKTFFAYYSSMKRDGERYTDESLNNMLPSAMHYGMDYLVVEPQMKDRRILAPENAVAMYMLENYPGRYRLVYTSPKAAIKIYRLFPGKQ